MGVAGRRSILCGVCPLPRPSALFFICVMGACLQGGMGAHGWVVRCFQPSVQSPSWSWLRIVEALNVNLEMSRWCHSLWISLHFLKTRVWPLLWWGFSFRTSFCFFYIIYGCEKWKETPSFSSRLDHPGYLRTYCLNPWILVGSPLAIVVL